LHCAKLHKKYDTRTKKHQKLAILQEKSTFFSFFCEKFSLFEKKVVPLQADLCAHMYTYAINGIEI